MNVCTRTFIWVSVFAYVYVYLQARERECHTMLKFREVWTFTALVVVVWSHRPARYTVDDSPSQLQDSFYCVPESWQGGRASTIGVVSRDGQSTVTMVTGVQIMTTIFIVCKSRVSYCYFGYVETP